MNITEITPSKPKKEKIRLAAYARVSSDSKDQLHSYAAQIIYYTNFIKTNPEYQLVDIYADEGITGTEMEKRDELNRLLQDCKRGKVDRIIVKSISRFARNTEELLIMIRMLKAYDVSVYFEDNDIDTEKLNMEMIVTFPGMAAQQESEAISGNLRWSYKKRMQSGEFNCTRPAYGYKLVDGEMSIVEEEAQVVRKIFELFLQGNGIQAIADILNNEKVVKRDGKNKWICRTVRYILSNERYKGDAILQKTYGTDCLPYRRKRNKGERKRYYVENSNPPIVERETFDKVQELLKTKVSSPYIRKPTQALSGRIRCPICGSVFRRRELGQKNYWICSKYASGMEKCVGQRVREDMVYDAFMEMLYKLKNNLNEIVGDLIKRLALLDEQTNENRGIITDIDKEIADLSAKNLVVTRLHTNGILCTADYTMQTSEINRRLNELRRERNNKLKEKEDITVEELNELMEIIEESKLTGWFDEDIFKEIVTKVVVEDSTKVSFYLMGGLKLTEEIKEKGRCKRK